MVVSIASDPIPLRVTEEGPIYVGETRVPLDLVIVAYLNGESAEGIAEQYDTLDLGDVYAVLGYYLRHQDEIDEYMKERRQYAADIKAKIEAQQGNQLGLRDRLSARLSNRQ